MAKPSRFAHLFRAPVRASEDDENTNDQNANSEENGGGEGEGEEEKPKNRKARRAEKAKKAKKAKKSQRAEDDDNDDADGQDDVAEDEGDDETDAEDEDDDEKASARARERGRGAAIFSAPGAAANPALAAQLAFTTNLPRRKAISILNGSMASGSGAPARAAAVDAEFDDESHASSIGTLDQRMSRSRRAPVPAQEERQGRPDPLSPGAVAARMVQRARSFRK
ncbi:hypothetical protein [Gluconobacter cerinus]|uniref:Phage protein n=1 Tax=Gluconobacter cerinus TaxID=38307 RepID=A0AAV5NAM3_9PROT|nr:hypothetical protein [Gluconobacter cerinus]GBR03160.1 hypothetical protein AA0229_1876 [Gluconobacter cerinus NRIC 0229]GLQ61557.1 hypothetical protein GCM10007867_04020 [Gluconobacter cerinus]